MPVVAGSTWRDNPSLARVRLRVLIPIGALAIGRVLGDGRTPNSGIEASAGLAAERKRGVGSEASAGCALDATDRLKARTPNSGIEASAGLAAERKRGVGNEASAGCALDATDRLKAPVRSPRPGIEASAGLSGQREQPAKASTPKPDELVARHTLLLYQSTNLPVHQATNLPTSRIPVFPRPHDRLGA